MANQRQRILIYHQACIGDLLMALPAMQAIRQFYPEAQIDLLAVSAVPGSIQKTLIEPLNLFEKMTFLETYGNFFQRLLPRIKIIKAMRRAKEYDKVFMLTFNPRWFEYFVFQSAGVKDLISLADWSLDKGGRRANDVMLDALESYGIPCAPFRGLPDLKMTKEEVTQGKTLFQSLAVPVDKIPVLMCVGGRQSASRFPLVRYLPLLKNLIPRLGLYPVFLCGNAERRKTEDFIKELGSGKVFSAGKDFSLREVLCSLRYFRFYLGNDTGAIHLAAAAGLPCIGLYGDRDGGHFFYPMGSRHVILQAAMECQGCGCQICPKGTPPPCLLAISDEKIIQAIETFCVNFSGSSVSSPVS